MLYVNNLMGFELELALILSVIREEKLECRIFILTLSFNRTPVLKSNDFNM
jgi:hypothetical protein